MTEPTDSLTRLARALAEEGHTKRGAARLAPLLEYALHTWKTFTGAGCPAEEVRARLAGTACAYLDALTWLSDPDGTRRTAGETETAKGCAFDVGDLITAAAIQLAAERTVDQRAARRTAERLNRDLPLIGLEALPPAQMAEALPAIIQKAAEFRASDAAVQAPLPGMASALLTLLKVTPPGFRDAFVAKLAGLLIADGVAPELARRWAHGISVYAADMFGRMEDMSTVRLVGTA